MWKQVFSRNTSKIPTQKCSFKPPFCFGFTEAAIFFQRVQEVIVVRGISNNKVGTSYILENAKIRKRAGFWRDRNLFHVRQLHCPRKFFSTLENLLSRDIVSICYYSHILMKSAVLREFNIWSGAFPFFRCRPD